MLIDAIRSLFGSGASSRESPIEPAPVVDPLALAACALLLEVAHADGEFSAAERAHLEEVLERHFSLPLDAGRTLLDLAEKERKNATDHFRFTSHLEEVLERHFSLPLDAGRTLLDLAEKERKNATDHFRFTSHLQQNYDTGQKMVLAEVMWGVVLADGEIAEREHYLTRKISNLLGLEPGYLSAAKAAATRKNS